MGKKASKHAGSIFCESEMVASDPAKEYHAMVSIKPTAEAVSKTVHSWLAMSQQQDGRTYNLAMDLLQLAKDVRDKRPDQIFNLGYAYCQFLILAGDIEHFAGIGKEKVLQTVGHNKAKSKTRPTKQKIIATLNRLRKIHAKETRVMMEAASELKVGKTTLYKWCVELGI